MKHPIFLFTALLSAFIAAPAAALRPNFDIFDPQRKTTGNRTSSRKSL